MTNFQLWKRVARSLLHLEVLKLENKERDGGDGEKGVK